MPSSTSVIRLYAAERPGFTEEDPARRERLASLKDDIRKSGFPVAENFATPKQLGEWVLRDLTAVIETSLSRVEHPRPAGPCRRRS